jgi:hypothetical protein
VAIEAMTNSNGGTKPTTPTEEQNWKGLYHQEVSHKKVYEEQSAKLECQVADLLHRLDEEVKRTESEKKAKEEALSQESKFEQRYKELKATHDRLSKTWEKEIKQAALESAEYAKDNESLRSKIEELRVSLIKSVNNIDTGLEPISDQTFRDSFITLHHKVCSFRPPF